MRAWNSVVSALCEDVDDKSLIAMLWCQVCTTHERSITGLKNFSRAWIVGSTHQKSSNVVHHAKSEQHHTAMSWVHAETAKAPNLPVTTYLHCTFSSQPPDNEWEYTRTHEDEVWYVLPCSWGRPIFLKVSCYSSDSESETCSDDHDYNSEDHTPWLLLSRNKKSNIIM